MTNDISFLRSVLNETNLQILTLLRTNSLNTREIARLLQKDETYISRCLRTLERLGIVEGKWRRVRGKNVRIYSLKLEELKISFSPDGLKVVMGKKSLQYSLLPFSSKVPEVKVFVGRKKELELLSNDYPVIIVYGIAGIGKSTLVAKAYQDAFWYRISGDETIEYIIWQLALYLNLLGYSDVIEYLRGGGKDLAIIKGLTTDGINKTGSIIVFDDIHKCDDEDIMSFIRFLASSIEKGKLILISREKPQIGYTEKMLVIHLKGLDSREAYELLKLKLPNLTPEEFTKIYHATFGHPLALLLAAEMPDFSGENFFEYLFREVYEKLGENEKLMLQIISLFDEPVEYEALKKLFGRNTFSTLYSLLNKALIERTSNSYYIHDLLKALLADIKDIEEKKYYAEYIKYLLKKNNTRDFLMAFKYAIRLDDKELIKKLTEIRIREFWRIALDFPTTYLKLLNRIKHIPYAKKEIARIYFNKGFFDKALQLWLEVKGEIDDDFHKFDVIMMLMDVYCELGRTEEAEKYLVELKEIYSKHADDPYIRLGYYIELTKIATFKMEREKALENAFKELEAVRNYPKVYPELEALVLYHIGYLYVELGKLKKALKYYKEGLKVSNAYSLPFMENLGYIQLGIVNYTSRNYEASVFYSEKAAKYYLHVKNYRRAIDALFRIAVSLIGLKRLKEAENRAKEMLELTHTTNYPLGWCGYVILGIARELRGKNGKTEIQLGLEKIKDNKYLYKGLIEELLYIFDEDTLKKWFPTAIF
ncbi:NB-ARC domain-containing protein [Thermococcus sp.]